MVVEGEQQRVCGVVSVCVEEVRGRGEGQWVRTNMV